MYGYGCKELLRPNRLPSTNKWSGSSRSDWRGLRDDALLASRGDRTTPSTTATAPTTRPWRRCGFSFTWGKDRPANAVHETHLRAAHQGSPAITPSGACRQLLGHSTEPASAPHQPGVTAVELMPVNITRTMHRVQKDGQLGGYNTCRISLRPPYASSSQPRERQRIKMMCGRCTRRARSHHRRSYTTKCGRESSRTEVVVRSSTTLSLATAPTTRGSIYFTGCGTREHRARAC